MAREAVIAEVLWGDLNEINDTRVRWCPGSFELDGVVRQFNAGDEGRVHILHQTDRIVLAERNAHILRDGCELVLDLLGQQLPLDALVLGKAASCSAE